MIKKRDQIPRRTHVPVVN